MSRTPDLPPYHPHLTGEDPGDECYIDLTPESPRPETRMVFCWCPPEQAEPGFWLGKHLVTQAQWQALMGKNPSHFTESGQHPVDSVSYDMAHEFALRSRSIFRDGKTQLWLPREAQWERACRAGHTGDFGIGAGHILNSQMANFDGNHPAGEGSSAFKWLYREKTLPVGSFPPNAWGLHDMHGQLWEWCADWLDEQRGGRVLRGGSWFNYGRGAAAGIRLGIEPQFGNADYGLRVSPSSIQQEERSEIASRRLPRRGKRSEANE